jgi:hypothetical protein
MDVVMTVDDWNEITKFVIVLLVFVLAAWALSDLR